MNDTKYSPGTSKTEELMDGSFRSAMSYIALLVKSWKLNPLSALWQSFPPSARFFC